MLPAFLDAPVAGLSADPTHRRRNSATSAHVARAIPARLGAIDTAPGTFIHRTNTGVRTVLTILRTRNTSIDTVAVLLIEHLLSPVLNLLHKCAGRKTGATAKS